MNDKDIFNISFYISTNNKHHQCLKVFIEIFNNFLPSQKINILGYDVPEFQLPSSCNFISMGTQGGVNEWSTDLRKYFKSIKEEIFIYGTEDAFLIKKPNVEYVNYLSNFVLKSDKIGRINLVDPTEGDNCSIEESPHYKVETVKRFKGQKWGDWSLYTQEANSGYALTTQFSIWKKDFLLKFLIDNMSPWDFEMSSLLVSSEDKRKVFMVFENYPISKKEGYSLGKWTNQEYWIDFISEETKNEIF